MHDKIIIAVASVGAASLVALVVWAVARRARDEARQAVKDAPVGRLVDYVTAEEARAIASEATRQAMRGHMDWADEVRTALEARFERIDEDLKLLKPLPVQMARLSAVVENALNGKWDQRERRRPPREDRT